MTINDLRELTISDLREVLDVLNNGYFPSNKWFELGLSLGLLNPKLEAIREDNPRDSDRCLQNCLTLWLREDFEATWSKLAHAIDKTGEKVVAAYISKYNWNLKMNYCIFLIQGHGK